MPIHTGQDKNGKFYQWGKTGKKYYFKPEDKQSKQRALNEAKKQQTAIYSSGWKGDTMKLVKVKATRKADKDVGQVIGDFTVYASKIKKDFGKFGVRFLTLFGEKKVIGWIEGPLHTAHYGSGKGVAEANGTLKEMKQDYEDYKNAISYATKTEKELQKKLDDVIKEAEQFKK